MSRRLTLDTPEEVPLTFELASPFRRMLAFGIDLTLIITAILVLALLISQLDTRGASNSKLLSALLTLFGFLAWNFYFIAAELTWQGRTVGKRLLGMRVIARDGGPLTADLVFARNLTRDLEVLIPVLAVINPAIIGLEPAPYLALCWLWLLMMPILPWLNRYRARLGDLVAGTLVVDAPATVLLPDLAGELAPTAAVFAGGKQALFTEAQLDLYGIRELQLLEDILRRYPDELDLHLLEMVADRIKKKIAWTEESPLETHDFLKEFYAAQRARLERGLLFGQRREHKAD